MRSVRAGVFLSVDTAGFADGVRACDEDIWIRRKVFKLRREREELF